MTKKDKIIYISKVKEGKRIFARCKKFCFDGVVTPSFREDFGRLLDDIKWLIYMCEKKGDKYVTDFVSMEYYRKDNFHDFRQELMNLKKEFEESKKDYPVIIEN